MTLPLSSTTCACGEPSCDSFNCCSPVEYKERPCVIEPLQEEVCIDYDEGEPFVEEGFFEAIIVDENCDKVITTEDCIPIYGLFAINE